MKRQIFRPWAVLLQTSVPLVVATAMTVRTVNSRTGVAITACLVSGFLLLLWRTSLIVDEVGDVVYRSLFRTIRIKRLTIVSGQLVGSSFDGCLKIRTNQKSVTLRLIRYYASGYLPLVKFWRSNLNGIPLYLRSERII